MSEFGKRIDGPGGRRLAPREPVLLPASLQTVGCSRPVILLDLSACGTHLQIHDTLRVGQEVWIKAAPIELFGTVAWTSGEQCGITFDEPLGEEELALLQSRGQVSVTAANLSPEERLAVDDWKSGLAR